VWLCFRVAAIGNLGRYRGTSPLGSGEVATVVVAQDMVLGRLVALKRVSSVADAGAGLRAADPARGRPCARGIQAASRRLALCHDVVHLHILGARIGRGRRGRGERCREPGERPGRPRTRPDANKR